MDFKTLSVAGQLNKNTCLELTVTVRESSQTTLSIKTGGFPGGSVKDPPAMRQTPGFDPWVKRIPWRRTWLPTPVFLPGESPWTEEPGRLPSTGLPRVRHD